MSRQIRKAKRFVRGRRFLTAALITIVVVGLGVAAGTSFLARGATTVAGDATCGYSGTTQFTESTVMRWAQVNGTGLSATFSAYANDENSTLLGVNTATPMPSSTGPQHVTNASGGSTAAQAHDGVTLTGSEGSRPYYPALYITPVSGPGSWTKPGDAIPQEPGDWQQGGTPRNISDGTNAGSLAPGTPYVNDVFGDWVVGTQTTNPGPAPGSVGTLSNTLSTTVNNTTLTLQSALTKTVTSGDSILVSQSGHTQTFKASATVSSGTSIPITGAKANFAYSSGAAVSDTTAQTGNYARQASLPSQNTTSTTWNLGTGSDNPIGTTFASMGSEGYGTEFRWNASGLTDYQGNALTTGQWYKIQVVEHDGDQNKGGDSGEFCTLIKIPGPPDIKTDPTGGNSITGPNVDGHVKQWLGTTIKDTAFVPAKSGFGIPTGTVTFNLYFDSGNAPTTCAHATDTPPGTLVYTDTETLDSSADPAHATSGVTTAGYDTSGHPLGTYYWQDVFTPGGSNASSYTTVTEACGSQTDQMVDARVRLTPHTAVNIVGNTHTLHAIAETSTDGSTWTAQSGEEMDTSLNSGTNATYNGASATANPVGSCVTASGQTALSDGTTTYCNVTITDSVVEDVLINATSNISVTGITGGVNGDDSITRSTDNSAACASDNATGATCEAIKHYINPKTTLTVTDTLKGLGSGATGSIQYTGYTSLTDCQGTTTNAGTTYDLTPTNNSVSGDAAPTSKSVDVAPGVTIYFTATYSGNEGNLTTDCTAETASSS
jgi:hypothetical protein